MVSTAVISLVLSSTACWARVTPTWCARADNRCVPGAPGFLALALRRDTLVSVEYSEELNFTTSSATYQRTNRHGILGQKPSDFQCFL